MATVVMDEMGGSRERYLVCARSAGAVGSGWFIHK